MTMLALIILVIIISALLAYLLTCIGRDIVKVLPSDTLNVKKYSYLIGYILLLLASCLAVNKFF